MFDRDAEHYSTSRIRRGFFRGFFAARARGASRARSGRVGGGRLKGKQTVDRRIDDFFWNDRSLVASRRALAQELVAPLHARFGEPEGSERVGFVGFFFSPLFPLSPEREEKNPAASPASAHRHAPLRSTAARNAAQLYATRWSGCLHIGLISVFDSFDVRFESVRIGSKPRALAKARSLQTAVFRSRSHGTSICAHAPSLATRSAALRAKCAEGRCSMTCIRTTPSTEASGRGTHAFSSSGHDAPDKSANRVPSS